MHSNRQTNDKDDCRQLLEMKDCYGKENRRDSIPNFIRFRKLFPEAVKPTRQTTASLGLDLYTPDFKDAEWVVMPDNVCLVDTGIVLEMQVQETSGFRVGAFVKDKSSVAFRDRLCIKGGVIDPDFRGSIKVLVRNEGKTPFRLSGNQKIAQIVFVPTWCPQELEEIASMETKTERGTREFGGCNVIPQQPETIEKL